MWYFPIIILSKCVTIYNLQITRLIILFGPSALSAVKVLLFHR